MGAVSAGPANLHSHGLRLVGADVPASPPATARVLRQDVARENRSAAMAADDVRLVFASLAAGALEGDRAAILRPHKRRELLAQAARMGLRPFDANLIIAVVQDQARRGEAPAADGATAMLGLFRTERREGFERPWLWIASVVGGLLAFAALASWVAGG